MRSFPLLVCLAAGLPALDAAVSLHGLFKDHMVIQRELPVAVWGTAEPGEAIRVKFAGQTQTTTAGNDGKWSLRLAAMKATTQPADMMIAGTNEVVVRDVVVGDVWVCSGQSNMEWQLGMTGRAADVAGADHAMIRHYHVPKTQSAAPIDNVNGSWVVCTPQTAAGFTAVGYYFARAIHQSTQVPIGLIHTSWGGTLIEPWTSAEGLAMIPEAQREAVQIHFSPSPWHCLYNSMIYPLVRYPIKGAIWYQGESNALFDPKNTEEMYYHKMNGLVGGWRKAWDIGEFPFYFVQLANFEQDNPTPEGGDAWAKLRMGQLRSLGIPRTGMAVAIDLADPGNPKDIHPKNKKDVGERLAAWALAKDYGKKDMVCSGPLYKAMRVEGNRIRIAFDSIGGGLLAGEKKGYDPMAPQPDDKLKRFAIAGDDRKWFWADAAIDGRTVVVSSPDVPKPVAVSYAYSTNPEGCNLYNKEGFPASPFRAAPW